MSGKPVFAEHAEKFTMVVHALLHNEKTRSAFAKDPIATLKQYGIEFTDAAAAKKAEAELAAFAGSVSMPGPDGWPPQYFARTSAFARATSYARATSITWIAKGDLEDVIRIDENRVDAFVTQVGLEDRIAVLEKQVAALEANLAKR